MNARKKTLIVFAILLVFLLLYSMNFIQLQDIGDEKNEIETGLKDYEDLTKNHENFTKKFQDIDKNTSFSEFNLSSSPLSIINNTFSFIGEWNSNIRNKSLFGLFERTNGKIQFLLKKTSYMRWKIQEIIYDGYYFDDINAEMVMEFDAEKFLLYNRTLIVIKNVTTKVKIDKMGENIDNRECENTTIEMTVYDENYTGQNRRLFIDFDLINEKCEINVFTHLIRDTKDYNRKAILYSIFVTFICIINFIAVIQMIKEISENENEGNKYSLISLGWISIWDCYLSLFHFYVAVNKDNLFQYFVTPSFAYFTLYTVFETRLIILVWKARYFPAVPFSEVIRSSLFRFYYKFYLCMIIIMFLAYKYIMNNFFMVSLNLFLIPQIIHNAFKGQQTIPNYFYLYSLMASRSFLPLYFRGCPHNLMDLEPSFLATIFLVLVILIQLAFLHLQDLFGNRFFIPECFFPNKYNYFISLPNEIDLENCNKLELMDECVICMNPLHRESTINFENVSKMNATPFIRRMMFKKNAIMKAPCEHKFHNACLIEWMSIKMECPTCRKQLPPL